LVKAGFFETLDTKDSILLVIVFVSRGAASQPIVSRVEPTKKARARMCSGWRTKGN